MAVFAPFFSCGWGVMHSGECTLRNILVVDYRLSTYRVGWATGSLR
jgi:hypothetical protein